MNRIAALTVPTALFLLCSLAASTEYFVDNQNAQASDTGAGTAAQPFRTIARAVRALVAGDTVTIRAGTYREAISFRASGTAAQMITLRAYPGQEGQVLIKGSDVFSNWSLSTGEQYSAAWNYTLPPQYPAADWPVMTDPYVLRTELVFVDGQPLKQVTERAQLGRGKFFVDDAQRRLFICLADGSAPAGHLVEASVRQDGFSASGNWMRIKGLTVKHVANPFTHAALMHGGDDSVLENNRAEYNNLDGLHISGARNRISNNVSSYNGETGISGQAWNCLIENNVTDNNSWRFGFNWADGGMKIVGGGPSGNTVRNHIARNNDGPGIWFDWDCRNNRIENCYLDNNKFSGIFIEASWEGHVIANNIVRRTRSWHGYQYEYSTGMGINIGSTRGAVIYNNTLIDNERCGIIISGGVRGNGSYSVDTLIKNNIIAGNRVGGVSYWLWDLPGTQSIVATHRFDYNLYHQPGTFLFSYYNGGERYARSLAEWRPVYNNDANSLEADPLLVNLLGGDARLQAGSSAIDRGTTLTTVTRDFAGTLRPQGAAFDIGAYEGPVALQRVATPVISPNGGSFSGSTTVTLSCGTTGATLRYTTNGAAPTVSSTLYSGPFSLSSSATVKAIAFKTGMSDSLVATASFVIQAPPVGDEIWLSDLTWTSMSNGWGPAEKDKSNGEVGAGDGSTLALNGVTYAKGLGVHALSEIRYALSGKYVSFTSDIGVDDEVGANGSLTFEVWLDGVKAYDSGLMTGSSATKTVSLSVSGKNELRLVVSSGGDNLNSDHADWAGARLKLAGGSGTIGREYWLGIPGEALSALIGSAAYPYAPNGANELTSFEAPTDWADNYGTRIRGFVHAPLTGAYIFWIAGDDNCELYLSSSADPAAKVRIASVPGWTYSREWNKFPQQKSSPITLTAGQKYYIEALQKEGSGGDNLAVGWQLPNGTQEMPIPGQRLSPGLALTAGTGLLGEYFDNKDFTAFKLTRTDATVNFGWGSAAPVSGMGADTFSVRWTGQLQPKFSETYTFYTTSDDGVRLYVNGVLVINNWTDHAPKEDSGTIALVADRRYDIKLLYYENGGGAVARLSWSSASQAKQIIPQGQLFPVLALAAAGVGPEAAPAGESPSILASATSAPVGQPIDFSYLGSVEGDVSWDFGDGSVAVGQSLTHTFVAAGIYSVTVTAGGVSHALSIEITPAGEAQRAPAELSVQKLGAQVLFDRSGRDQCAFAASAAASLSGAELAGLNVRIDVGGAQASFVLDAKGRARSSQGSVSVQQKNGKVTIKAALKDGAWAAAWVDEGLISALGQKSISMKVEVTLGVQVCAADVGATYLCAKPTRGTLKK